MKGSSGSTKGKASLAKAGSRRRPHPFRPRASWIHQRRRRFVGGVKLATYSSSDESPERPAKVVVVGVEAGRDAGGSPVHVPVVGGGSGFPRFAEKIGESDGGSIFVPRPCDGIGEGSTTLVPIPKMCAGGGSPKEAVKVSGGAGSRLRFGPRGQLYVLDSEDEDIGKETGLYAPDSEEDGGSHGCRLGQLRRRAQLPTANVQGYKLRRAVAMVVDPAPNVAVVVDVPVGDAIAVAELHPALKVQLAKMDPILHETYLSMLKICLPAFFNP